jgi:hypothetical protein
MPRARIVEDQLYRLVNKYGVLLASVKNIKITINQLTLPYIAK